MSTQRDIPPGVHHTGTTPRGEQPTPIEVKISPADHVMLHMTMLLHVANRETALWYRTGQKPPPLNGNDAWAVELDLLRAIWEADDQGDRPLSVIRRGLRRQYTLFNLRSPLRKVLTRDGDFTDVRTVRRKPILFHDDFPHLLDTKERWSQGEIDAEQMEEIRTYLITQSAMHRDILEDEVIEPLIRPFQQQDVHLPFMDIDGNLFDRFTAGDYFEPRSGQAPITDRLHITDGKEPLASFLIGERKAAGLT